MAWMNWLRDSWPIVFGAGAAAPGSRSRVRGAGSEPPLTQPAVAVARSD